VESFEEYVSKSTEEGEHRRPGALMVDWCAKNYKERGKDFFRGKEYRREGVKTASWGKRKRFQRGLMPRGAKPTCAMGVDRPGPEGNGEGLVGAERIRSTTGLMLISAKEGLRNERAGQARAHKPIKGPACGQRRGGRTNLEVWSI